MSLPANPSNNLVAQLLPDFVAIVEGTIGGEPEELWPEEAAHIATAVEKRRKEFACGRLFARRAFRALGVTAGPLLANPDRSPHWPDGLVGSIAHTDDYCAVAVAKKTEAEAIGIDVENVARFQAGFLPYILSPDEIAANLQGLTPEQQRNRGVAVFSAKEAFYKCIYSIARTPLSFHDGSIVFDDSSDIFRLRLLAPAGPFRAGDCFAGRYIFGGKRVAAVMILPQPAAA